MIRASRQGIVVSAVLFVATAGAVVLLARSADQPIDLGFWFEPTTLPESDAARLGGAITPQEMQTVAATALFEVRRAFAGLRITISDSRDALYRVAVVPDVRDWRFKRAVFSAGESRAIRGLGGRGTVSFRYLAAAAINYAPPDADRASILDAIGRGIGRTAVHEFTHQLLPLAPIHDSADVRSYEYRSASRRDQYYGEMHWDIAGPLLRRAFAQAGQGKPESWIGGRGTAIVVRSP